MFPMFTIRPALQPIRLSLIRPVAPPRDMRQFPTHSTAARSASQQHPDQSSHSFSQHTASCMIIQLEPSIKATRRARSETPCPP